MYKFQIVIFFMVSFVLWPTHAQRRSYSSFFDRAQVLSQGQTVYGLDSSYKVTILRKRKAGFQPPETFSWTDVSSKFGRIRQFELKKLVSESGGDMEDQAGSLEYRMRKESLQMTPFWVFGLTPRWSIALKVPVISTKTSTSPHIKWNKAEGGALGPNLNLNLENKASELSRELLEREGYDPISTQEKRGELGDVVLQGKFLFYQTKASSMTLDPIFVFPSGRKADPYEFIDTSEADGQADIGLGSVYDYNMTSKIMITSMLYYRLQLKDSLSMRVPGYSDSLLGYGIEQEVKRDLGDIFEGGLNVEYKLRPSWSVLGGFSYFSKGKDHYSGKSPIQNKYLKLNEESDVEEQIVRVGISHEPKTFVASGGDQWQIKTSLNGYSVINKSGTGASPYTAFEIYILF